MSSEVAAGISFGILLVIFAVFESILIWDKFFNDKDKYIVETEDNDNDKADDPFHPKYMLIRCKLCGATVCKDYTKQYFRNGWDSSHQCPVAKQHEGFKDHHVYPIIERVAFSNHTFYKADYIKISDGKYQDKKCNKHNHW